MSASIGWMTALIGVLALTMSAAGAEGGARIEIKEFMFAPDTVSIRAGESVTWSNQDDEPHTVVSDSGAFRSGALDTGDTFTFRFERAGTYHFTCSIHPKMVGTITVN